MAVLAGTAGPLPATDAQASGTDHPALVIGGGASLRMKPGTRLTLDCDLRNYGTFTAADGSRVVVNGFGAPSLRGVTQFADLQMAMHGTAGERLQRQRAALPGRRQSVGGRARPDGDVDHRRLRRQLRRHARHARQARAPSRLPEPGELPDR
jgi:hypothetical protein